MALRDWNWSSLQPLSSMGLFHRVKGVVDPAFIEKEARMVARFATEKQSERSSELINMMAPEERELYWAAHEHETRLMKAENRLAELASSEQQPETEVACAVQAVEEAKTDCPRLHNARQALVPRQ